MCYVDKMFSLVFNFNSHRIMVLVMEIRTEKIEEFNKVLHIFLSQFTI